jgi:hypothetical protein
LKKDNIIECFITLRKYCRFLKLTFNRLKGGFVVFEVVSGFGVVSEDAGIVEESVLLESHDC